MKKNPLDFVRPNILALEPYSTARDEFKGGDISVWLDANESPYRADLTAIPNRIRKTQAAIARLRSAETVYLSRRQHDEPIDLSTVFSVVRVRHAIPILD